MNLKTKQKIIKNKITKHDSFEVWHDWKWQLKHQIRDIQGVEDLLHIKIEKSKRQQLEQTIKKFPLSVTPYYLSLIDENNFETDPVFMQSVPSVKELDSSSCEMADPLHEDGDSPVPGITHRYPDRVLFLVSNMCSMYCRHCTRKRKVGDQDFIPSKKQIKKGLTYIKNTPQVRDVLLSGGDPLMLSDEHLEWILSELRKIPHVEIIRIGSRMPVVLPYRITDKLVSILRKYQPLWINTHFNHPRELTNSSQTALSKLADAGIPLGNQTVLLAGINDCPRIMKALVHRLMKNRVRPYYLYQCDHSEGLMPFRTPVGKGIEIIENLVGHTSGLGIPTYVIDAPGGGGKIPVMPNYIISWSTNKVILRNYEGTICTYKEPDSYVPQFCDRDCKKCNLQLQLDPALETSPTGIMKLFSDTDKTISLVPEGTERVRRRKNH
ncbi:MAG: lysine 2,3-aminomutase [Candidatus Zapsychrus exili]|nr:lysine 2,3-aminomutase [Candidatus Zapsychrus exili]